jgi:hypothetical protein
MLKTNEKKLAMISVQGTVVNPSGKRHSVDRDGVPYLLPGTGGITYNIKVGDCAFGWAGDHLEPGVSTVADEKRMEPKNTGYNFLACVGNRAIVASGDAKGDKGVVTGHHGGAEHVLIDFPDKTLDKMHMDDRILVRGFGQGLELADYPDIHAYNIDPGLLKKMGVKENRKAKTISVPVVAVVPGQLMGSGVGSTSMGTGDYDIMTTDQAMLKKHRLDRIRFGDFVAITDHDNVYGRSYRKGAVTVGIVIHSDCRCAGHGPGVTTVLSCTSPKIKPVLSPKANIADIMKIGRRRK